MAKETIYADGIRCFDPRENAPEYILGAEIIEIDTLKAWCDAHPEHCTKYKGKRQIRLSVMKRKDGKGISTPVDTYKPEKKDEQPF